MATVEWQTTCTDLKQRGALLLETEAWKDCEILVGPEAVPFRAHKLMLAMASPVFESMLFADADPEHATISIPDVKPKAFEALVNYIYTENIDINSFKRAHRLYMAANNFLLDQLARVCAEYMCCNVTMESACAMYEAGHKFQDNMLMYEGLQMIKLHIKDVLHHKSFEEANIDTVVAIFAIPDLRVEEIELFQALERYVQANYSRKRSASSSQDETGLDTKTRQSVRKALAQIRFLSFSLEEFAKGPAQSGLFTKGEALALMINIANGDSPLPPGFSDSRQPRYQKAAPPKPAPVAHSIELRVSMSMAPGLYGLMRRSVTSPRAQLDGRYWTLRVVPHLKTNTSCYHDHCFALFLRCEDAGNHPGWACVAKIDFVLLGTVKNRSVTKESPFSSTQRECGVMEFVSDTQIINASMDNGNSYYINSTLTFEARITIEHSSNGPAAASTSKTS